MGSWSVNNYMTTSIDWVHEIDASLVGTPLDWRCPPSAAFFDYAAERGPYVRRLAHAICCDWTQAETLSLAILTSLQLGWSRIGDPARADEFVHRALGNAVVTDSPTPRSCNARGDDYPFEDESLLFDGLQSLTVIQRKALVLHHWLDVSVPDVADILQITAAEVQRHAARARSAINFLMLEPA
ncbi:RNA polymerase sigma factor [Nocardioides piscis]|uniref:RNA polymerase sigma factor 70 region 4 type 2 domain-containing protein n=1 Tax=Nocardioides piscis TaxID=2714938 RepID=A0A6G7YED3_9ACTN|nr:sigma factor-like helix-turn-helix DNA-binding protein [Nocardioides piscis]QIK75153.1 hypothetical protein G7071_06655 [Nocardioides piscis]